MSAMNNLPLIYHWSNTHCFNCVLDGCKIPDSAAVVHSLRLDYAKGETIPSSEFTCPDKHMLSSSDGMECLEDGIWSHIITCVKGDILNFVTT